MKRVSNPSLNCERVSNCSRNWSMFCYHMLLNNWHFQSSEHKTENYGHHKDPNSKCRQRTDHCICPRFYFPSVVLQSQTLLNRNMTQKSWIVWGKTKRTNKIIFLPRFQKKKGKLDGKTKCPSCTVAVSKTTFCRLNIRLVWSVLKASIMFRSTLLPKNSEEQIKVSVKVAEAIVQ